METTEIMSAALANWTTWRPVEKSLLINKSMCSLVNGSSGKEQMCFQTHNNCSTPNAAQKAFQNDAVVMDFHIYTRAIKSFDSVNLMPSVLAVSH